VSDSTVGSSPAFVPSRRQLSGKFPLKWFVSTSTLESVPAAPS
jgi:hypothetical protein